jgi:uncharacterized surface protein with fasciclin (FAS1) repeats
MRKTSPRVAAMMGIATLALATMASAQMTPPGERMPEAPAPSEPPSNPTPPPTSAQPTAPAASDQSPVTTNDAQTVTANVVAADRLSTLESAVTAAGLAEALGGAGPFTVFAPDNGAFAQVPPDALQVLMQPANRAQLSNVLQAHVVAGRVTAAELLAQIQAGGGRATLETIGGDRLVATRDGGTVVITGANNSRALVTQADANASNGVIHIVNGVLLPAD